MSLPCLVYSLTAAVYNNLDCCELLSSSHLSMATKLLEVSKSALIPDLVKCWRSRISLWNMLLHVPVRERHEPCVNSGPAVPCCNISSSHCCCWVEIEAWVGFFCCYYGCVWPCKRECQLVQQTPPILSNTHQCDQRVNCSWRMARKNILKTCSDC